MTAEGSPKPTVIGQVFLLKLEINYKFLFFVEILYL
jgi:hypothetical protein